MKVIGLTGGIASGKSAISRYLRELGAAVIDADLVARELVEPHTKGWQDIVEHFGPDFLRDDQTLDRKKLGSLVFASSPAREALNGIIHPLISKAVQEKVNGYRELGDYPLVVFDAPLLIEAGMTDLVDEVWLVAVPPEVQIKRIMERDHLTREAASLRLQSQLPLDEKTKYAHRVIDNNRPLSETLACVHGLWLALTRHS